MAIITLTKAKLFLGIPEATTDKDELIKNLVPAVQEDVRAYANDDFFNFYVEIFATMTFDKTFGSITIPSGSFIDEGFAVGQTIQILGSDNNNYLFTIEEILATEIIVAEVEKQFMTDEVDVAAYAIKIEFPLQYEMVAARMVGHLLSNFDNANIKSKKISRLSISYANAGNESAQGYPLVIMKSIKRQVPSYKYHDRYKAYNRIFDGTCTLMIATNVDWDRIAAKSLWGIE